MAEVIEVPDNAGAMLERIKHAEDNIESTGAFPLSKYSVGAWSPSKLKMLTKCGYQFYLKYILKVKNEEFVQDTQLADAGTIGHRILEHIILGRDVDEAFRLTKKETCEVDPELIKRGKPNVSEQFWNERIIDIEANVISFKERIETFERNNKVTAKYTELNLGVTRDWKKTTFFAKDVYFRGIIDLCLEIDANPGYHPDLLILDHKNGGGDFAKSTKNYQTQLDAYKPLYHYGFKNISNATAGIHFIRAGTFVYDEGNDHSEISGKLKNNIEWDIDGAIEGTIEKGYFKHVAGNHCTYCEFAGLCKSKALKENELSTKKYFPINRIM